MMDYHAIHGYDISSFGNEGTHRLPTVSASQALKADGTEIQTSISFGLAELDSALIQSADRKFDGQSSHQGGLRRGQVTEIWGAPGTGKTALGLQSAVSALCNGYGVVWVDCFQDVSKDRLLTVLRATMEVRQGTADDVAACSQRFAHYSCLTLPHLMGLVARPTNTSIASNVALIVVSSLSSLVNAALPKAAASEGRSGPRTNKDFVPSIKRRQALQFISGALQKLAATRNCAVLVMSHCATKLQSELGATLTPAVNAAAWEQGIATRLVAFRDWTWARNGASSIFLVGCQKLDGKTSMDLGYVTAFNVTETGVSKVAYDASEREASSAAARTANLKRKLGHTRFEIPDSEDDEDYGWADEDEASLPAPPPQWQGSEDILLGLEVGRSENESNADSDADDDDDDDDDDGQRSLSRNSEGVTSRSEGSRV